MEFDQVLERAQQAPPSREEALFLLRHADSWDKAARLFAAAAAVRDRHVGRSIKLEGFICCITPCHTDPPCRYCWRSSSLIAKDPFGEGTVLNPHELAEAAAALERVGMKRVELAGGTMRSPEGARRTLQAVRTVRQASALEIWVNNGPSLTCKDDVLALRDAGAFGIACHFETISPKLWQELRPGESLEFRMQVAQWIDEAGVCGNNTLMVGLGQNWGDPPPYEQWVDFLFWLKQLNNFRYLEIGCFRPIPGTQMEDRPPGSVFQQAKLRAVARLLFPDIDISGASTPLGILSGANRWGHSTVGIAHRRRANRCPEARGPLASRPLAEHRPLGKNLTISDLSPLARQMISEMGMEVA